MKSTIHRSKGDIWKWTVEKFPGEINEFYDINNMKRNPCVICITPAKKVEIYSGSQQERNTKGKTTTYQ